METVKENDINTSVRQQTAPQNYPQQESDIPITQPPGKIKKSINHIGLITLILSILTLLGTALSLASIFILSKTNILPEEDILFLTNQYTQNSLLVITSFISIIILGITIFLSNKLRKDDLLTPENTHRNLLIITLVFVFNFLSNLLSNGLYSSTNTTTESEVTFSFPIFEIIILFVLIKGLIDFKKYMKES